MQALGLQQHGGDVWSEAVWTVAGQARLLLEPRETVFHVASQPLVAGFTADAEARAQLGHAPEPGLVEFDEVEAFGHGRRLLPRHGAPPDAPSIVDCHPCSRSILLPVYPVCTGTRGHRREERRPWTLG